MTFVNTFKTVVDIESRPKLFYFLLNYYYLWKYFSQGIKEKDVIVIKNSNLFVGGVTGRSGTTWIINILGDILANDYVIINEFGSFVLNQIRKAAYEFYQPVPGTSMNKRYYLKYFRKFVTHEAFNRHKLYGEGLRGFSDIVPKKAIEIAFNHLEKDLESCSDLAEITMCFGDFYSRVLNFRSLLKGKTLNWISKEPGYGRHVNELYNLIPDCRVLIMVRDGRDTVLSMIKQGWFNGDIKLCINRWKIFATMTLSQLEKTPNDNYLIIRYQDLINDFKNRLVHILRFFNLEPHVEKVIKINLDEYKYKPIKNNFNKWEKELGEEDINYFNEHCKELMERFGYHM